MDKQRQKKPLLMVPLQHADPRSVRKAMESFPEADGFEIWIDQLQDQREETIHHIFRELKKLSQKKLVAVCKSLPEKGKFKGSDKRKTDLLLAAKIGGADYVDLPISTIDHHVKRLKHGKGKAKLIISFHDFEATPRKEAFLSIIRWMKELEADVIKIATMVRSDREADRLMHLALELKGTPHIIIGMGKKGMITRVFSEELGNELTFVAGEHSTAPGQLTLQEWRKLSTVQLRDSSVRSDYRA